MSNPEIKKNSLLIVKSIEQNLLLVETFLRNRGWDLFSTTDLKEAIGYMIQNKPAFVMISVDHPNKNVVKLSRVITQAFPCCVIAFAEKAGPASYSLLSESSTEYLIYPPVTGPAVERTVNKFLRDQSDPGHNGLGEKNYSANYQPPDRVVNIKGSGPTLQSLLAQIIGDDTNGVGYTPDQVAKDDGNFTPSTEPGINHNPQGYTPVEWQNPGENFEPHAEARLSDPDVDRQKFVNTNDNNALTRNFKDSIILEGSRDALDKATVKSVLNKPEQFIELKSDNQIFCILIKSPRFSGYLLTAVGRSATFGDDFINLIRERLFNFLVASGENITDQKNISLQLKQVPFKDWAIEHAEFLCKSQHHRNEVAMAFFPHRDALSKLSESASEKMYSIEVSLLEPEAPVSCNIYLYLRANQKYILYTPQGGKIYSKQLDKLRREGVSHLHILKDQVQAFDAYRAQNYLNSKIGDFEKRVSEEKKP